jgi:hypothetical protein
MKRTKSTQLKIFGKDMKNDNMKKKILHFQIVHTLLSSFLDVFHNLELSLASEKHTNKCTLRTSCHCESVFVFFDDENQTDQLDEHCDVTSFRVKERVGGN